MTELDAEIAKDKRLLAHALKLPDTKQQRIDDPISIESNKRRWHSRLEGIS
jgi:hypothetical protein